MPCGIVHFSLMLDFLTQAPQQENQEIDNQQINNQEINNQEIDNGLNQYEQNNQALEPNAEHPDHSGQVSWVILHVLYKVLWFSRNSLFLTNHNGFKHSWCTHQYVKSTFI